MFVSRAVHAEVCKRVVSETARADAAEDQIRWLRAMLDRAYTPTDVTAQPIATLVRKEDKALEVVALRAGTSSVRRAHLTHWVKEQRVNGVKEDEIVHTLMHWPEYDPGEPE